MRITRYRRVRRRSNGLQKTIIATVVLLVVLVGSGIAYTYFGFQNNSIPEAKAAANVARPGPFVEPAKQDPNAPASASIQSLSSPVAPGSNASITVRTNQLANCQITVAYNGAAERDSGLAAKSADKYSMVSWTWTVSPAAAEGSWPVSVTCNYNGRTAVVRADLKVSRTVAAP